jgi:glutamate transport system permease protein
MSASALYDEPGPRGRAVNRAASMAALALFAWLAWVVYDRFDQKGQWESEKWKPFLQAELWETYLLPGISGTLRAFAVASVLALVFGFVFGVGRMSNVAAMRWGSGAVVEFFRGVPLVLLMFFLYVAQNQLLGLEASIYWAVIIGLMLYNGSVLAEIIRSGVYALPKGQREAGLANGLTDGQVMRLIQLPQAVRAMLPAMVAQEVVLLKDTALGYILAYNEMVNQVDKIALSYQNLIPAAIVVALLYIAANMVLGWFAIWLEKTISRRGHTAAAVGHGDALAVPAAGQAPEQVL